MRISKNLLLLVLLTLFAVGCSMGQTPATVSPPPTNTPIHYLEGVHIPNLKQGEQAWAEQQCDSCHGPIGLGGIGPALADTPLEFEEFLHIVRTAILPKPSALPSPPNRPITRTCCPKMRLTIFTPGCARSDKLSHRPWPPISPPWKHHRRKI